MSPSGKELDLARAVLAQKRADGPAGPKSKYMPGVPRVARADGGSVMDGNLRRLILGDDGIQQLHPNRQDNKDAFLAGNHPAVPDVLYHSSRKDFGTFFPLSHFGTLRAAQDRAYGPFSNGEPTDYDPTIPSETVPRSERDVQIYPVHLSIKKPLDMGYEDDGRGNNWGDDSDMLRQVSYALRRHGKQHHANALETMSQQAAGAKNNIRGPHNVPFYRRAADIIQDAGFDGLMYKNRIEDRHSTSFVPLIPNQIKSALGNRGTYDPNEHEMTKAEGGPVGMGDNGGPPLSEPPVDLGMHRFHRNLMGDVRAGVQAAGEAARKAHEAGVFDGYEVGDRYMGKPNPFMVEGRFMREWKPSRMTLQHFARVGVTPTLIEHEGKQYVPMIRYSTGREGDDNWQRGDMYLDMVRHMNYPKVGKLRSAFAEGGPVDISTPRSMLTPEQNETFTRMARHGAAVQKGIDAGLHRGLQVGDEFTRPDRVVTPERVIPGWGNVPEVRIPPVTQKGKKVRVTGLHMSPYRAVRHDIEKLGITPTILEHEGEQYVPSYHYEADNGNTRGIGSVDVLLHQMQNGGVKRTGGKLRVANPEGFAEGGVPKLYSKAAETIRSLPMPKAPVGQYLAALPGRGVKKAEIENANLPGNAHISREDMARLFESAKPQLGVRKFEEPRYLTRAEEEELDRLYRMNPIGGEDADSQRRFDELTDLKNAPDRRKYARYTDALPGDISNYREHLLTLPEESTHRVYTHSHWPSTPNVVAHLRMEDHTPTDYPAPHSVRAEAFGHASTMGGIDQAYDAGLITLSEAKALASMTDQSRFSNPNAKVGKYLHLHEAQSDWNSSARKAGMVSDRTIPESEIEAAQARRDNSGPIYLTGNRTYGGTRNPEWMRHDAEVNRLSALQEAPPAAPYVSPTDSQPWIDLAMKHLLHTAAEGGYDGISVTTPEDQMRRWRDPEGVGFKKLYGNDIPKSLMKHAQMHDPSIAPATANGKNFAIPLTEKARQSILSKGFPAFQRGGYIEISHG